MKESVFNRTPLVCCRCRHHLNEESGPFPLKVGEVFVFSDDRVVEGFLVCTNEDCGQVYPVIEGIPVVLKDMHGWWAGERSRHTEPDAVAPAVKSYLETLERGDAAGYRAQCLKSSYMDLHYGRFFDFDEDPCQRLDARLSNSLYWKTLADVSRPADGALSDISLELGCSVGGYTFELAKCFDIAVGLDANFSMVATAEEISHTGRIAYEKKRHGQCFDAVETDFDVPDNVLFLVGDALDPPFPAEAFDLVAGMNLLENVEVPVVLIGQMNALLKQGGIFLSSSPYEWRADLNEMTEWLEFPDMDAPQFMKHLLEGRIFEQMQLSFQVLEQYSDVPWILRNHDRYYSLFFAHILRALKSSTSR